MKAESDTQKAQDEQSERVRQIEAEINADKVALTKELDKGIDWVAPKPALPSKIDSKSQFFNSTPIRDDISHKRLKDLKKFITLLQRVATTEGIEINTMSLPINKQMLLDEIKKTDQKLAFGTSSYPHLNRTGSTNLEKLYVVLLQTQSKLTLFSSEIFSINKSFINKYLRQITT